jgi:hypothetical protein
MRLYLHDEFPNAYTENLAELLRQAGHDVLMSASAPAPRRDRFAHLRHAIRDERVLLTHEDRVIGSRDDDRFLRLHELIVDAKGHHPGILVVLMPSDSPGRNMSARQIVRAIDKASAAGVDFADVYLVLNDWR